MQYIQLQKASDNFNARAFLAENGLEWFEGSYIQLQDRETGMLVVVDDIVIDHTIEVQSLFVMDHEDKTYSATTVTETAYVMADGTVWRTVADGNVH